MSGSFEQNLRRESTSLFFNLFVLTIDGSLHHAMERFSREGTKHEPAWSKPRLQTDISYLKSFPPYVILSSFLLVSPLFMGIFAWKWLCDLVMPKMAVGFR